jgi:hypothetical protein
MASLKSTHAFKPALLKKLLHPSKYTYHMAREKE